MQHDYVPDRLWSRFFQPWTLPEAEWPLAREDWKRVDAICGLPWKGNLLDFGSGDGTLAAMVCSRNPKVGTVYCIEQDDAQIDKGQSLWTHNGWDLRFKHTIDACTTPVDGALCCEVLEHMTPDDGANVLKQIHAALKPGAMLCVTVPKAMGPRGVYPGHITMFRPSTIKKAVAEAGFLVLAAHHIGNGWLMVEAYA